MPELVDWLASLLRLGHVLAAVAWIGTSFYFNWFDLLVRPPTARGLQENDRGTLRGTLYEVHGGSFYYHEQYWPDRDPPRVLSHAGPAQLTLITGLALMALMYWFGARAYLIDPRVSAISQTNGILLSAGSFLLAWPIYYAVCKAVKDDRVVFAIVAIATTLAAFGFSHTIGGRATFIQIGAMLGIIMALSVQFVIVPNHIKMQRQIRKGEPLEISLGEKAKRVSKHNNYFTLPVLFAMLSTHFPLAFGHVLNWLILALVMGAGVTLRHWRNVALKTDRSEVKLLVITAALLLVAIGVSVTPRLTPLASGARNAPTEDGILQIVHARCTACHSAKPSDPGIAVAPLGLQLDSIEQIKAAAAIVHERAVRTRDMPLNNSTGMSDGEREALGAWLESIE